jgi:hypothetical protein
MKNLGGSEAPCPKLSTGEDSTLGNWVALVDMVFGPDCAAAKFLNAKIAEQGKDQPVIADEGQLIMALVSMNAGEAAPEL